MADLKSFINTSSDRIKSAMGVPVDRIKTIQGSLLNKIPEILKDGNSKFYDFTKSENVIRDVNNLVSEVIESLGDSISLVQVTDTNKPLYQGDAGIKFNINKVLKASFTRNQPHTLHLIVRLNNWNNTYRITDGFLGDRAIVQQLTNYNQIKVYAGTYSGLYNLSVGSLSLISIEFNGVNSSIKINGYGKKTISIGTQNAAGIAIGVANLCSDFNAFDVIVRAKIDTDSDYNSIIDFLSKKRKIENNIVIIGDSTAGFHSSGLPVIQYSNYNKSYFDTAVAGYKIAAGKSVALEVLSTKTKAVIIQIGVNDSVASSSDQMITAYQQMINEIRAIIGSTNKIIISTMLPTLNLRPSYLGLNEAILGNGSTPITGVDVRLNTQLTDLNDGSGNLAAAYDSGDGIHENILGRQLLASLWDDILTELGIL